MNFRKLSVADISICSTNGENIVPGDLSTKYNAVGDRILSYCIELHSKELLVHKEQSTPELWILQNKINTLMSHLSAKSGLIVRQIEKSLSERILPKKSQSTAACKLEELREGITGRAANQLGRKGMDR